MSKSAKTTRVLTRETFYPLLFCVLYFAVHFIPYLDAIDPMGTHWFYLALLDAGVTIYILAARNTYGEATRRVCKNLFSLLYLGLFTLAGLSTFTALNATEAWVCFARLIVTVTAFFNIAILLHGRISLVKSLAQVLAGILLIESVQTLFSFFNGLDNMQLDQLILSLRGNTGLKNIFAASLVVKIPFVLYCIAGARLWLRITNIIILILGALAIFIINARSSYVGLALILLIYIAYCWIRYRQEKKTEVLLYGIGSVVLPLIASFFISQVILSNAVSMQDSHGAYGTVTERLGTISFEGGGRSEHWGNTITYIKQHPFAGCGYGNWKIASIPYGITWANNFTLPLHSHNDFLELAAELGIQGSLLYLGLFVCLLVFTVRTLLTNAESGIKMTAVFSFMAMAGYFVDACLNFPMERPIMQVFFAFIAALNVSAYNEARRASASDQGKDLTHSGAKPLFGLLAILFLLPAIYLTYVSYRSMVAQLQILPDLPRATHVFSAGEVDAAFPPVPNLTTKAQPVDAIKGTYYYYAKQYDKALVLLDKGTLANPYTMYSEFMKANIYFDRNNVDSAISLASRAFYSRPRAFVYFQNLLAFLAAKKDTAAITKAFREYTKYRNETFAWRTYITSLFTTGLVGTDQLGKLADSAIQRFPGDTTLMQIKQAVRNVPGPAAQQGLPAQEPGAYQRYLTAAVSSFNKGEYAVAAQNFARLSRISPAEYAVMENAGICYFNLKEYGKAISWFDKAIATGSAHDGKSEFYKAKCLLTTGKKSEGCQMLQSARSKNYPEAEAFINQYCK